MLRYSGHVSTVRWTASTPWRMGRRGPGEVGGRSGRERRGTLPTGVALRDVRDQLFDAAERVLIRDGPSALTTRAVTTEAGVANGVLHRHFADFDAFLAELVLDRVERMDSQAAGLREAAGTGNVAGNGGALTTVFESVAVAIVGAHLPG